MTRFWSDAGFCRNSGDCCARSVWDYDRIMYYKATEIEPTAVPTMIGLGEHELERVQAENEPSKMALHYSVKTLASTIWSGTREPFDRAEALRLVDDLQDFLDRSGADDDNPKIRRNLGEIRGILDSLRPAS